VPVREPLLYRFVAQGSSAEDSAFDRMRLLVDGASRLRGAAILGEGAAERILVFALALQEGISVDRLQSLLPVVPTAGESLRLLTASSLPAAEVRPGSLPASGPASDPASNSGPVSDPGTGSGSGASERG
jgi:hypothetical protein